MATTPDNPSEQDRFEYDHNAASAFMWAWAQLEGWGDQKDGRLRLFFPGWRPLEIPSGSHGRG
jgi:hypothetical protein